MSVKYKIENAKLNKKLVGDEVTVSKLKKQHGDGPKGPKQPRVTLKDVLKEMREGFAKQNEFNNKVSARLDSIDNQFKTHGGTK